MNPWRGLSGLPREIWVLFIAVLINRSGTMALPFLVLYLTESVAIPASRAGLVLTFYGIGSLVTSPLAGRLSDRFGMLRIMKLSLLLSGAILFLFPLTDNFTIILAIATAWAVISEAFRPASMAIITELVAPDRRKAAFALNRLAVNLGMSIGPAVGGFIAMISFPALFYIDGATSILAGVVLMISTRAVKSQAAPLQPSETASGAVESASVFSDRRLLYFLAALFPVCAIFFQSQSAMPLYLVRDMGMLESTYGLMFAINTVLIILIEVPLNTAMAGWSHRTALSLGALLTGIGFGALALVAGPLGVAVTIVVWTFGEMIFLPGASAYVADIAPADKRGLYMGFFQMAFGLAFAVGPWVGTIVLEEFGASVLWASTFALSAIAAAMMLRLRARPEQLATSP